MSIYPFIIRFSNKLATNAVLAVFLPTVFLLMLLLNPTPAHAITIKVVTENLPPYQIVETDGSLGGYATEVVQMLFRVTRDTPDIQVMPWARAYDMAKDRKNVMIFTIAHSPRRAPLFKWVGRLKGESLHIWGLKSKFPQPFNSIEQMRPYTIGFARDSNLDQYFTEHQFPHLYRLVRPGQNLGMLFNGRVDLIIGGAPSLRKRAKKQGFYFSKLNKLLEVQALNNDLYIAFNLNSDPKLVSRYQRSFKKLQVNGMLKALKGKWGITD